MIYESENLLRERIEIATGRKFYGRLQVTDDTSNYFNLSAGTVLRLDGDDYYVTGEAREGRFGISEQPKFWVKYAFKLSDCSRKIIKLVFYESFTTSMGLFTFRLTRNPEKESRVLALVAGDDRFMQGKTVFDKNRNNVRIIDFIRGRSLYNDIAALDLPHEVYFKERFPAILSSIISCLEALEFLAVNGLQHGDVRNDHIIIDQETGKFRWIDFDFEVNYGDYDVWSIGNILTYVTGMGIHVCRDVKERCDDQGDPLGPRDALLFFKHRLANLRKIFPYLPVELNDILMHFSTTTVDFYEDVGSILKDLRAVSALLSR